MFFSASGASKKVSTVMSANEADRVTALAAMPVCASSGVYVPPDTHHCDAAVATDCSP